MTLPKNTICLWYDHDAEAAARFYAGVFPDSAVHAVFRAPADYPSGKAGDVLTARGVEVSRQGRGGIYDITVTNQDGVTIALFRGHSRTVKGEFFPGVTIEG